MKTYKAEVVAQVLYIKANSEEEAESKYGAFFSEEPCPCGLDSCDCVEDSEDCYHNTSLLNCCSHEYESACPCCIGDCDTCQ